MSKLDELIQQYCPEGVEYVRLGDVCRIFSGKNKQKNKEGAYPVYGSTGIIAYSDEYKYDKTLILVARVGANAGYTHISKGQYDVSDNTLIIDVNDNIQLWFIYYLLVNIRLNQYAKGGGQPLITAGQIKEISIPLPPLPIQEEIVRILDTFTE
ncbi:MAG: restriction endonuclease subunit S, partial [Bacteroidales bacterium]|nr:restriction endonuclease subunit S [Bacteroidales bacterium]